MTENAKKMYCGACGNEEFSIYQADKFNLYVECRSCKSITVVSLTRPKIEFKFGEYGEGILTTKD
jgi:hypothetical protein